MQLILRNLMSSDTELCCASLRLLEAASVTETDQMMTLLIEVSYKCGRS